MYNQKSNTGYTPICNFVPGYAFYSDMGYSLAGTLVNLVEWFLGLRR